MRLLRFTLIALAGWRIAGAAEIVQPQIEAGFRQMYNLNFAGAHTTFEQYGSQHPEDPLVPVSDAAAYLFSEFDRLHILEGEFFLDDKSFTSDEKLKADPRVAALFEKRLAETARLSNTRLAANPKDTHAIFAKVLALGLRSDYDALIDRRYLKSVQTTKENRRLAEQLIALDPTNYDVLIAIGLENYMLSLKPMPVRWILQLTGSQTDHDTGVAKLKITAEKGQYLRPFAQLLLAMNAMRERLLDDAEMLLRTLSHEFPGNHLYADELRRIPKLRSQKR